MLLTVAILTQFSLDLIVGSKLGFKDRLPFLLLLYLFVNLGDLVSSAPDLRSLIARVHNHVLIESLFKAFLLLVQLLCLLLVLGEAIVKSLNFGLILTMELLNSLINLPLDVLVHAGYTSRRLLTGRAVHGRHPVIVALRRTNLNLELNIGSRELLSVTQQDIL